MNLGTYDITIDFSKLLLHNSTSIYFKERDLNTAKVKAKLTMQRKVIDITGCSVIVKIETTTGEKISDIATIVDAANGIVEIDFKSNSLIEGTNFFELKIVKDQSVKESPKLAYRVLDSIDDTGSIEGANEYPILIQLISDTNKAINKAKEAYDKASLMQNDLGTVINNANETINAINNAKNEALEAVEDVKKAIAAGTQDLEVKNARGGYTTLDKRLDSLDKDLLKAKDMTTIPITTENNFVTVENTVNEYFEDIKLEGKTLVVNSKNEEVLPGTEGATLKSVGEDVDEIVLSSIKSDGNLFDGEFESGTFHDDTGHFAPSIANRCANKNKFILVSGQTLFVDSHSDFKIGDIYCYDSNKKYLGVVGCNSIKTSVALKLNTKFINFNVKANNFNDNFNPEDLNKDLYIGVNSDTTQKYKTDKKKLLYYDTESKSWKKTILREWDSVQKHSDGKYYYHKGSIEKIVNGNPNENWTIRNTKENTTLFGLSVSENRGDTLSICDQVNSFSSPDEGWRSDSKEGIYVIDFIHLNMFKSKADSVESLKTRLQSNPLTVAYKAETEKIYECTPIDLIAFENETNYMIECGPIIPKSSFKHECCVGNVINTLKEKVSYLEDKLYKTNLANFTVALNALDTKLKLEQLTKTPK